MLRRIRQPRAERPASGQTVRRERLQGRERFRRDTLGTQWLGLPNAPIVAFRGQKGISGITQQGGARVAKRTARKLFEEAKAQLETAWRQWLARSKLDERYDWVLLILRSDSLG
jgi:hypothetical protein